MKNDYNLLLNEIVSRIFTTDFVADKVKIYVQKYNDINLLLKLNNELLNCNSDCEVIFYCDKIDENNHDSLNIIKNENVNVDNISNLDFDFIISDLAFHENEVALKDIFNYTFSKLLLTISSSYFDENKEFLQSLRNTDYFNSIISLPIYDDNSNLLILNFDSSKRNNQLLIIDESDSLIHENVSDWSLITDDLSHKIINSYSNFIEYENSLIIPTSRIIQKKSIFGSSFENYIEKGPSSKFTKQRVVHTEIIEDVFSADDETVDTEMLEKNPNLSFKDLIYGKKRQDLKEFFFKDGVKLIDENIKIKTLGELANLKEIKKKSQKESLLMATCKDCTSDLVFNHFDVDEFKENEKYIQINGISKDILPEFLKAYLNSIIGLNEIFYFTKGDKLISIDKVKNINVPIISKDTQKNIVKASQEANKFFKEIDLLKKEFSSNIFDYENTLNAINEFRGSFDIDDESGVVNDMPEHWWHVYQGLVWPLAISYLVTTRGKNRGIAKLDNYLVMFEFIAAFNFIILLSALPDTVYQKFKYKIWNSEKFKAYKTMSFGAWITLTENISEVYNEKDFPSVLDEKLVNMVTSNKIFDILNEMKEIRNNKHHGSMYTDEEADEILKTVDEYLESTFDILEVYSEYELIYFTGNLKRKDNKYEHEIILLNGPFEQPVYSTRLFDDVLYEKSLYLYNPNNKKRLLINDNLMKFVPTDKYEKHWGLFLYSKWENESGINYAYYKCFQSKEDDLSVRINSFKDNIVG